MTQKEYLTSLYEKNPDAVFVGSLGTISYDLAEIANRERNPMILIKGAMGAAMSCGLGYAMGSNKQVIVLIGEGSFLMKAGHIAEVFKLRPSNLQIKILVNNQYKSCGGQSNNFRSFRDAMVFNGARPFIELIDCE